MYIVCIEANPTDARWMAQDLQSQDHEVVVAKSADEGWNAIQKREPAMVIIDQRLADASRLSLTQRIREHYPRCAIVFTSDGLQVTEVIMGTGPLDRAGTTNEGGG